MILPRLKHNKTYIVRVVFVVQTIVARYSKSTFINILHVTEMV